MYGVHQLASASLTMVFAAVMLVVRHWYIEKRSRKFRYPTAQERDAQLPVSPARRLVLLEI